MNDKDNDTPKEKGTPELLAKLSNIKPETDELVVSLANETGVALIAMIAPYTSVRISPVEEASASISIPEEFGFETIITEIKKTETKKVYLLVNSPGGSMSSSYKVARALRMCLEDITVFVPHIAASGGTLMALIGNRIVMGPMSQLSPLDVQIHYRGAGISMAVFQRFFARASMWFEKCSPEEAPYPQKAMTDKLDPFIMEEWSGVMDTAIKYVNEILKLAGYENCETIADMLVTGFPTHSFVINPEDAKNVLNLNIEDSDKYKKEWEVMRYWLGKYALEESPTHCIRYVIPNTKKGEK